MIVIPEMKEFHISDSFISSPLGEEIIENDIITWFQHEYGWEDPQIFLCYAEDGSPDGIMCRERDDDFFIRDPQYKEVIFSGDDIIIPCSS